MSFEPASPVRFSIVPPFVHSLWFHTAALMTLTRCANDHQLEKARQERQEALDVLEVKDREARSQLHQVNELRQALKELARGDLRLKESHRLLGVETASSFGDLKADESLHHTHTHEHAPQGRRPARPPTSAPSSVRKVGINTRVQLL